jgi:hypothetical protein
MARKLGFNNGLDALISAWFTIKVTVLQIKKTTETQRHRENMGRKRGRPGEE